MADRYWVGGAGTWDATTTTNWSATSGGAGGASAPTSADNVIFNSLSNATAYAVTVGTNAAALDITIAGPAVGNVTITSGATAVINCYGSWLNAATGVVFTSTTGANVNFIATTTGKTIATNNVTFGAMGVVFNGANGAWTLVSAVTVFSINAIAGTFNTGNFNLTLAANLQRSATTGVATVNLGSSAISCAGSTPVSLLATNLTFNAGTSTITCSATSSTFAGGGLTYYNVSFTNTGTSNTTITGANTFNNLTQSSTTSAIRLVVFSANQTVTGTLTLGAANTAVLRVVVRTDAVGTQRTLTVATIATLADVDFQDIVAAGASGTWSGTRLGNCTNNSNITFGAGKTVYWNLAGAQNWNATGWAASSGASPAVNNFPLAQDTAVFDGTGAVTGIITINQAWMLPAINIQKTGAMTLASGVQAPRIFGGVTLQAATVTTGTGVWQYAAYGVASTFTSNTATFTSPLTINAPTGTVTLADGFTQPSTVTTTLTAGTLDLASYTLTTGLFSSTNSNTRVLAFGTGKMVLTGTNATVYSAATGTGLTMTGTRTIELTGVGVGGETRTLSGSQTAAGGVAANAANFYIKAGADIISLGTANRVYGTLDFTGFSGSTLANIAPQIYGDLVLSTGMTVTGGSNFWGFVATTPQTITTNGKTIDNAITFDGVGGTWALQDALTLGSTRTLTLTNGTLKLKSGTTSTVGSFTTSGTNQKFLSATTPGTQATISDASGTNSVSYLTIQDSNATGGAVFEAFTSNANVNAGNNTGWYFLNSVNFFPFFN